MLVTLGDLSQGGPGYSDSEMRFLSGQFVWNLDTIRRIRKSKSSSILSEKNCEFFPSGGHLHQKPTFWGVLLWMHCYQPTDKIISLGQNDHSVLDQGFAFFVGWLFVYKLPFWRYFILRIQRKFIQIGFVVSHRLYQIMAVHISRSTAIFQGHQLLIALS